MSSTLAGKFTVAISRDFFLAFAKLPQAQQLKVHRFVEKFQQAPDSAAINYEQLSDFKDKNLRSVRIGDDYRAIILKPSQGSVYILLYVDHHDDAYKWARNKVVKINPEVGGLQIVDVAQISEIEEENQRNEGFSASAPALRFAHIKDKEILRLGVPEEFLPLVRAARTDEDVNRLCEALPDGPDDAIYMLASGYDIEHVYLEQGRVKGVDTEIAEVSAPAINTEDFITALGQADSQRTFYVVEDERELSAALCAPLEQWRVFLHPSQRKIVTNNWKGPVRVLGGAGTGKTVVAMHRAKWLAEKLLIDPQDRILFTTFTTNLAADIKSSLSKICKPEDMARIEVVNIDKWVIDYLRKNGYKRDLVSDKASALLWGDAMSVAPSEPNYDEQFYREEWEKVIQQNGITDRDGYLKVSRAGRGIALTRKDRDAIWPVFEEYRQLLNNKGWKETTDATRDARLLLENQGDVLPYKAVIVDEAQDMGPESFKLIRQILKNDGDSAKIFIVGDAHQRIYGKHASLSSCGIKIAGARGKKLRINYRTTEETRRWAVSILHNTPADDLDGGEDDLKGYQSKIHGRKPNIECFQYFENEIEFLSREIDSLRQSGVSLADVCIVGRTDDIVERYERELEKKGFPTYRIRRSAPDERKELGLRFATMHRVKGLQFEYVFIVSANDKILPLEYLITKAATEVSRREIEHQERRLLHVAATRAKREVFVSSFGVASRLLPGK